MYAIIIIFYEIRGDTNSWLDLEVHSESDATVIALSTVVLCEINILRNFGMDRYKNPTQI